MEQQDLNSLLYAGMAILLIIGVYNAFAVTQLSGTFSLGIKEAVEGPSLPKIELTTINSACSDCGDLSLMAEELKGLSIEIIKESIVESGSAEANALISEYGIEKLPAMILKGEFSELNLIGFKAKGNALVFEQENAPYEETGSGNTVGLVSAIILADESCEPCSDMLPLVESLRLSGIAIKYPEIIGFETSQGMSYIESNGIEKVPALLLSSDIEEYPEMMPAIEYYDTMAESGYYVIESEAPYRELSTGDVRGLVGLIYLDDESCEDCYDVEMHKASIVRFGVFLENEETVDVSSAAGKRMIQDYGITKVPTILLQGDVSVYTLLDELWIEQVGTKESDGTYVFRNLEQLGFEAGVEFRELE